MLGPKIHHKPTVLDLNAFKGKLRHHGKLVLHFNGELLVREKVTRPLKNGREFASQKPVFGVVVNPSLKQATFLNAPRASAVDEPLTDMAHLGDVAMRRHPRAIGQTERKRQRRMGPQLR